jgi:hypothetical protein
VFIYNVLTDAVDTDSAHTVLPWSLVIHKAAMEKEEGD